MRLEGRGLTSWIRLLKRDDIVVLHLFGGPYVSINGKRLAVPEGSKRLLAFVALHSGQVDRRHAAGALWPNVDDVRAAGNLRSSLWRLNREGVTLIDADKRFLVLNASVTVDVRVVSQWADRLSTGTATDVDLTTHPVGANAIDLLPGCYDDWALAERDRIRQRLLHALELMSATLTQRGRFGDAINAAMLAITADPLRESAQRALIEAHLAEGNWIEANRQFSAYRDLLADELGTQPHPSLWQLVRQPAFVPA